MTLPRLVGLKTYVSDLAVSQDFWLRHFGLLAVRQKNALQYKMGDVVWEHLPGGKFCGTRGPHGVMPVFGIDDFGRARGYLMSHDIPIVFEEMLPGMSLLVFLDKDSNPFELAQETDPGAWRISQRKALRTKRRQDAPQAKPVTLRGVTELIIYSHDITASVKFYRDVIGLPVGLAYFAHVHLVAENVPVALRTTRWQCKARQQLHGVEPVFSVRNLAALAEKFQRAGLASQRLPSGVLKVRDPIGIPLQFVAAEES